MVIIGGAWFCIRCITYELIQSNMISFAAVIMDSRKEGEVTTIVMNESIPGYGDSVHHTSPIFGIK